jgi:hypothetical protein
MAVAYVQHISAADFAAAFMSIPFPSNTTTGNLICGYVYWSSATETCTGVTVNGVACTLVHNPTTQGSNRACMFYLQNITGAVTPAVRADFSGTIGTMGISAQEVSGAATASALDQSAMNPEASTSAPTSGNVTTTTNGQYIFGGTRAQFGTAVTAGANFTLRSGDGQVAYSENLTVPQAAAGVIAAIFADGGGDTFITGIMTFHAAGAAAAPRTPAPPFQVVKRGRNLSSRRAA